MKILRCPTKLSLSAFIDHELSQKEYKKIAKHLTGCESCSKEVTSLKELTSQLQSLAVDFYDKPVIIPKGKKLYHTKRKPAIALCVFIIITLSVSFYYEVLQPRYQLEKMQPYISEHLLGERLHVSSYGLFGN